MSSPVVVDAVEAPCGQRLLDKVVVVTGGGGAIEREIVRTCLCHGASVAFCDVNAEAVQQVFTDLTPVISPGRQFISAVVDVTSEEEVRAWMDDVVEKCGGVDVLVNNAARFVFGAIEDVTENDWDLVLGTNVKGYAFCAKHAVRVMRQRGAEKGGVCGGSLVHIASISSLIAQPAFVPYNTSKGAVLQLSRCLALDNGPFGIRSNCVSPGTIDTPITKKHAAIIGTTYEELAKSSIATHCLKRLGSTKDVANAVLFLASDESSFITGANLTVDGGFTAT